MVVIGTDKNIQNTLKDKTFKSVVVKYLDKKISNATTINDAIKDLLVTKLRHQDMIESGHRNDTLTQRSQEIIIYSTYLLYMIKSVNYQNLNITPSKLLHMIKFKSYIHNINIKIDLP